MYDTHPQRPRAGFVMSPMRASATTAAAAGKTRPSDTHAKHAHEHLTNTRAGASAKAGLGIDHRSSTRSCTQTPHTAQRIAAIARGLLSLYKLPFSLDALVLGRIATWLLPRISSHRAARSRSFSHFLGTAPPRSWLWRGAASEEHTSSVLLAYIDRHRLMQVARKGPQDRRKSVHSGLRAGTRNALPLSPRRCSMRPATLST